MATISTHTLNSVDGSHAANVRLALVLLGKDGQRDVLVSGATDEGGRFIRDLPASEVDPSADYELVLQAGDYFRSSGLGDANGRSLKEIVMRFQMPDPDGRYHIPFMLAPNSYSVWMAR